MIRAVSSTIAFWILFCALGNCLKLLDVQIPEDYELGSRKPLILDCMYELEEGDNADGLVVQWYQNQNRIYQWIYPNKTGALGVWRDLIDLNYTSSSEQTNKYKALRIKKPSTNLTGVYECRVEVSPKMEITRQKHMTVFVPAKNMNLYAEVNNETKTMEVVCVADGVSPQPEVSITADNSRLDTSQQSSDVSNHSTNLYNITRVLNIKMNDLNAKTVFECRLTIPQTSYFRTETYSYVTGNNSTGGQNGTGMDVPGYDNDTVTATVIEIKVQSDAGALLQCINNQLMLLLCIFYCFML